MAITALATSNTQIGPSQYADMTQVLTARFKVDGPTDLQPSIGTGRTTRIAAGAAFAAGTRLRSTGTEVVTHDAVSSGTRYDAVVIRVDWTNPTATVAIVKGTSTSVPVNTSTAADPAKINRIPGVLYDALVCTVRVSAGSTTVSALTDYRMWGGDGGPMRVTPAGLDSPSLYDARLGTFIATDQSTYTKRLDDDGVWRSVGTASNPWKTWTPNLRYYGNNIPDGKTGGTIAGMGNGGVLTGRYRIVDGVVDAYAYCAAGSTGATWGDGSMTMDLPVAASSAMGNLWAQGHLFTTGYGGDGSYDWHAEGLIQSGWTRTMLWTNSRIDDCRLKPYSCQKPQGGPGSGVPYIAGGYPVGIWTFNFQYLADV